MKNFCSVKDTVKENAETLHIGRKYLQITYSTKDLYPEYIKDSSNSLLRYQTI